MRHSLLVVLLLSMASITWGQETKPIPAPVNFKVLAAYHKAMQHQSEYNAALNDACNLVQTCKDARDKLNQSVADYKAQIPAWLKEANLPADAAINVNDKTDAVTSTVPKKAEEKKAPEAKK